MYVLYDPANKKLESNCVVYINEINVHVNTVSCTWYALYCLFVNNFRNFPSKKLCSHFFFFLSNDQSKIGKKECKTQPRMTNVSNEVKIYL